MFVCRNNLRGVAVWCCKIPTLAPSSEEVTPNTIASNAGLEHRQSHAEAIELLLIKRAIITCIIQQAQSFSLNRLPLSASSISDPASEACSSSSTDLILEALTWIRQNKVAMTTPRASIPTGMPTPMPMIAPWRITGGSVEVAKPVEDVVVKGDTLIELLVAMR
jgi:hypothetical protein